MANIHGADLDEMTRLADAVERSASSVETVADLARAGAHESVRLWVGGDADDFRSTWANVHDPTIRRAAADLRAMAGVVRLNRDQQALASEPTTTGAGAPTPGGGHGTDGVPGGPTIQSSDAGRIWSDAFSLGERGDGLLIGENTSGIEFGAAAAGSYYYRQLPDGGFELIAEVDGRSGLEAQLGGTHANLFGTDVDVQGEIGGFVGGRGSGSANIGFSGDGYVVDLGADAFVGAEAYANGGFDAGPVAGTASAFALAGAGASAAYLNEFDGRNVRTNVAADAFYGAKAGLDGDLGLLDGDVSIGGGLGVSTGIGGGFSGGLELGLDEIGAEIDLGLALGLGFDASIDLSFSPSGLADDVAGAGNAALDFGKDATGWISPLW